MRRATNTPKKLVTEEIIAHFLAFSNSELLAFEEIFDADNADKTPEAERATRAMITDTTTPIIFSQYNFIIFCSIISLLVTE